MELCPEIETQTGREQRSETLNSAEYRSGGI